MKRLRQYIICAQTAVNLLHGAGFVDTPMKGQARTVQ
jgi:hypothetical protein